jgi:hypothetical protein
MVLTVEPLSMPPFQRCFEGVEKVSVCTSLEADSAEYLVLYDTRLVFQEKLIFEEGKSRDRLRKDGRRRRFGGWN